MKLFLQKLLVMFILLGTCGTSFFRVGVLDEDQRLSRCAAGGFLVVSLVAIVFFLRAM